MRSQHPRQYVQIQDGDSGGRPAILRLRERSALRCCGVAPAALVLRRLASSTEGCSTGSGSNSGAACVNAAVPTRVFLRC